MAVKCISWTPEVKRIECSNCGSTLEYTPNDVHERTEKDHMNNRLWMQRWIKCPNCGKKSSV